MVPTRPKQNSSEGNMRIEVAALKSQFAGLSDQVKGLYQSTNDGFNSVNNQFANFTTTFSAKIETLSEKMAAGSRTPWGTIFTAIGTMAAIGGGIIWFGYTPIQQNMLDSRAELVRVAEKTDARFEALVANMDAKFATLIDKTVSRADLEYRAERAKEDRDRMDRAILSVHDEMVPRATYDERRAATDRELDEIRHRIDRLSDRWEAKRP